MAFLEIEARIQKLRQIDQRLKDEGKRPPDWPYHEKDPPFNKNDDPHDGTLVCPYEACDDHNGYRTGFIIKTEYSAVYAKQVEVCERCRCHPGYDQYGA